MIVSLSSAKIITRTSEEVDRSSLQTSVLSQKRGLTFYQSKTNDSKQEKEDLSKGIRI